MAGIPQPQTLPPVPGARRRHWLEAYYAATPAFALLDWQLGANVRAVGLADHPELRAAYYAVCVGCAAVAWLRPAWAGLVGLAESGVNLLTLVLSIFVPYLALADAVLRDEAPRHSPITPALVLNFCLAAGVALALFYGRGGAGLGPTRLRT